MVLASSHPSRVPYEVTDAMRCPPRVVLSPSWSITMVVLAGRLDSYLFWPLRWSLANHTHQAWYLYSCPCGTVLTRGPSHHSANKSLLMCCTSAYETPHDMYRQTLYCVLTFGNSLEDSPTCRGHAIHIIDCRAYNVRVVTAAFPETLSIPLSNVQM